MNPFEIGKVIRRREPYGAVLHIVKVLDVDGERSKLKQITDGMPAAMWVSWKTLREKWELTR